MSSSSGRREFLRNGFVAGAGLALARDGSAAACRRPWLPQEDPDSRRRRRKLERTRSLYVYDHDRIPSIAMVERLPRADRFSLPWIRQGLSRVADLVRNFAARPADGAAERALARRSLFQSLSGGSVDAGRLLDVAREAASAVEGRDRPESLADFDAIFRTIALPEIAATFQEDRVFARHRVAGPNPLVIRRVFGLDERFPVSGDIYRSVLPDDRLEIAAAEGRLYLADYHELEGVELGLFRGVPKFLSAPLALFAVDRSGELVPVAIQCEQRPGPDNPIFTPHDGHAWSMAKTVVQIADANVHEAVSHLGRTHLFVEPFVIATERQLAESHPLRLLLRPHFEGTLAINEFAHSRLLRPGGFVDELLAGSIEASTSLAVRGVRSLSFRDAMLPEALRSRGVDDREALPRYPYRDDALLYWGAIRQWVSEYLRVYYRSELDVHGDFELAAWYRELVAPDGGRVVGLGDEGAPGGLEELIDTATLLIFTSSVQHAAVNFPQFELMTYVPNMPLAGFAPAPTSLDVGEQDALDLLPSLPSARSQLVILYLLGTVHHTTLGVYSSRQLCDPRIRAALRRFESELDRVGAIIDERNRARPRYSFLERGGIPQSINV